MNSRLFYGYKGLNIPFLLIKLDSINLTTVIDTGSDISCITREAYEFIKEFPNVKRFEDVKMESSSFSGTKSNSGLVTISFLVGRTEYTIDFQIMDNVRVFNDIQQQIGLQFHALLGMDFVANNKLVLDFADGRIHSKNQRKNNTPVGGK